MKLREWKTAKEIYTQGLSINPQDGKAYFNRGIVHQNLGNRVRAIADFKRAEKIFLQNGDLENHQRAQQFLKPRQPNLIRFKPL